MSKMACPAGLLPAASFGMFALMVQLLTAGLIDSMHPSTDMLFYLLTSEVYWFTVLLYVLTVAVVYLPQCSKKDKAE